MKPLPEQLLKIETLKLEASSFDQLNNKYEMIQEINSDDDYSKNFTVKRHIDQKVFLST